MVRRLRLWSGLFLMAFVVTHYANHALGIHSLEWMEAGRNVFVAFWRFLPVTVLFYAALIIHVALAFWVLYQRRRLKMAPWEFWQTLLGLTIPPLLVAHILGTRFLHEVYGIQDNYFLELLIFFVLRPDYGIKQFITIAVVWAHGCMGVHFWLRLKPWYPRALPFFASAALLLPVLGAVGVYVAGRQIAVLAQDPFWLREVQATVRLASSDQVAQVALLDNIILGILAALLVLSLSGRLIRRMLDRVRGLVHLTYPDGRRVAVVQGTTILEASRGAGIAHASVCGGRGRCSTCRVRVGNGADGLPAPSPEEKRVLERVGAPPNQRLACQTRPQADLEVTPILPPSISPRQAEGGADYLQGQEREIAILFADLRGFTTLAEHKLPYDVVFILNRYFAAMGAAVEASGGRLDKFIGDGVMALFGIEEGPAAGSRAALAAARAMAERLDDLNRALANDLEAPLRIGIGIHVGPVIVGEMGYGSATSVTAIGDAVNTASRLEAMTKEFGAQLVISDPVADSGRVGHRELCQPYDRGSGPGRRNGGQGRRGGSGTPTARPIAPGAVGKQCRSRCCQKQVLSEAGVIEQLFQSVRVFRVDNPAHQFVAVAFAAKRRHIPVALFVPLFRRAIGAKPPFARIDNGCFRLGICPILPERRKRRFDQIRRDSLGGQVGPGAAGRGAAAVQTSGAGFSITPVIQQAVAGQFLQNGLDVFGAFLAVGAVRARRAFDAHHQQPRQVRP